MPHIVLNKNKSIEENVEDVLKFALKDNDVKTFVKNDYINTEIENALKAYESKTGGIGGNKVDIKVMVEVEDDNKIKRIIPVMIEVKGKKNDLIKLDKDGNIELKDSKGNISKAVSTKAVNGAVHYANAIIEGTKNYEEVIAIGANGYKIGVDEIEYELEAYYISKNNLNIPKKIGDYVDISFLYKKNWKNLINIIDNLGISLNEKENRIRKFENDFESHLKELNQKMKDDYNIDTSVRVQLISGLLMAGMGTEGVVPLKSVDLKAPKDNFDLDNPTDNKRVLNKVISFLKKKNIPSEKIDIILNNLSNAFNVSDFYLPIKGEEKSKIGLIFEYIEKYILPMFSNSINTELRLDLTGKLFNIMNDWVSVPDGEKNDVVLTPRVVTDLMARLCEVNCDSYVWDFTTGTAGFLVSAMKFMIQDAEKKYKGSPELLEQKKMKIRAEQLLGIEKRADMYVLAVLNMILMGDGSTNILFEDSLEYDGNYRQGNKNTQPFPANVFLLNPPYSMPGKGLIFVEEAFRKMKTGKGAVLIQENAGSGAGGDYAKRLLKNNTLLASIHMPDIFRGKASVQTAIYLFEIGKPHDVNKYVKFIDFTNDGYARSNRRKSSSEVNFRNVDNAIERYEEVIGYILGYLKQSDLKYYTIEECFEDKVTLEGNDWTVNQHKKVDLTPTEEDFKKVVVDYLSWKVSTLIRGESNV